MDEPEPVILDRPKALLTARDYVCAGCWGRLELDYIPPQSERVYCRFCGDGRGFVRKNFTEHRRSDNVAEAIEVRELLESAGVIKALKRTPEQIIKELGY